MHVSVNGVRLFFDVEGAKLVPDGPVDAGKADVADAAWRPRLRPFDLPAGLFGFGRYRPDHLSRPSRQWPQRGRPAGGLESGAMGRRRARVLRRARHRRSDRAGRLVRRHGRAGLCHAPSGPSFQADPDQHRSRRRLLSGAAGGAVRALRRAGSRRAGAAALSGSNRAIRTRPRSTPGCGWPCRTTRASRAIRTWRGAPSAGRRCCNGSRRPGGESHSFNFFPDLHRIQCPTLVLGGEDDPIHPIESQADIAAALPPHLVRFERFADCRHACMQDAPEQTLAAIRDFIRAAQNKTGARRRRF